MPIYGYSCPECGCEITKIQEMGEESPKCLTCGVGMTKNPAHPAFIKVIGDGGYPKRSKGYKEGYSKEFLKDNPPSTEF